MRPNQSSRAIWFAIGLRPIALNPADHSPQEPFQAAVEHAVRAILTSYVGEVVSDVSTGTGHLSDQNVDASNHDPVGPVVWSRPESLGQAHNRVLSVPDTARMLGISRSHAYELVRRGELIAVHLGRRVVVPMEVVDEMLASRTIKTA